MPLIDLLIYYSATRAICPNFTDVLLMRTFDVQLTSMYFTYFVIRTDKNVKFRERVVHFRRKQRSSSRIGLSVTGRERQRSTKYQLMSTPLRDRLQRLPLMNNARTKCVSSSHFCQERIKLGSISCPRATRIVHAL